MLATNVAETSLTVPGIRYVVDPGTARISRYSHRTKVQRLPIEPISQASANQRKGRCGRRRDGICIRLYSEDDFDARPEFTEPEILRTNLASVILQMTALGLGDIAAFPFVDPPDRAQHQRRRRSCCEELGALDRRHDRDAADPARPASWPSCPVDPRLGPDGARGRAQRLRPRGAWSSPPRCPSRTRASARPRSSRRPTRSTPASPTRTRDFLAYLNLWATCASSRRSCRPASSAGCAAPSSSTTCASASGRTCTASCARSPATSASRVNRRADEPDADRGPHRRCWPACCRHIGARRERRRRREYLGARGARFAIFPGSALVQEAAALGDGRRAGRDLPAVGPGRRPDRARVGRARSPGTWSSAATASRTGTTTQGAVDGLREGHAVRRADRRRPQGQLRPDRPGAGPRAVHPPRPGRGRLADPPQVLRPTTGELLDEVEELEDRARRRDILVDDETLFDFYDQRVPDDVVSARHFDTWWKRGPPGPARPARLRAVDADRTRRAGAVDAGDYPDTWRQGGLRLRADATSSSRAATPTA